MNKRTQIITALAVTIGLLGACGGDSTPTDEAGDDVVETTSADTSTSSPATTPAPNSSPSGDDSGNGRA